MQGQIVRIDVVQFLCSDSTDMYPIFASAILSLNCANIIMN